jgi:hypothetical protein
VPNFKTIILVIYLTIVYCPEIYYYLYTLVDPYETYAFVDPLDALEKKKCFVAAQKSLYKINLELEASVSFKELFEQISLSNSQASYIKDYYREYHGFSDLEAKKLARYFYYCNRDPRVLFFPNYIKESMLNFPVVFYEED